jgi:ABC-2 type transport system ATP-binding protein
MPILTVRNLTKKYSDSCIAVNNVSFSLERGETLGILGPNGAGKTTTIHMLLDLLTPTSGSITYFGKDFQTHRSEILQKVGFGTTYARLPGSMTVYNNLDIYGRLYGLPASQRSKKIDELLELLDVIHLKNREAGELSAGETTRVILAKAFLADPEIVLLDEPTASLDIDIAQSVREFICHQSERGISFLFTSHNMHEMTQVCDRIIVMQNGTIVADNTPEQLSETVSRSFLQLMVGEHLQACINYAQKQGIHYEILGHTITFEIDEHAVAQTLLDLAQAGVIYTQISIKKPTLEDYFLSITHKSKKVKK